MSRLIDADKLKECDFGEYGYEMRYEIDRQPTAQAIPLDKVKRAKEGMQDSKFDGKTVLTYNDAIDDCVKILDKLIESE